jgi:GntR family transcriptional regulator
VRKASRITVRQALSELVQQGYLYTVPGKGFFVGEKRRARELDLFLSFTTAARNRGEVPSSKVLEAKIIRATTEVAHDLQILPAAEVVVLRRLRLSNDIPMLVQRSLLPHARCPRLLERNLEAVSLFATLREEYGISLSRAETTITARLADASERKALSLPAPGVVLVTDQLTESEDGAPVERVLSVSHPELHPLSFAQKTGGPSLEVT